MNVRFFLGSGIAIAACARGGPPPAQPSADRTQALPRVTAIGMTVSDLAAEESFLRTLELTASEPTVLAGLPFEQLIALPAARATTATLRLGEEKLVLTAFASPMGHTLPASSRSNDRSFQHIAIVVKDVDRAFTALAPRGAVPISTAPQTIPLRNTVAGGVRAVYFRDPENHVLELLSFPDGKGDARWHMTSAGLFLGIDHSAIVVSSTARSLAFYRDQLGLEVKSESLNEGAEQEALSGVPGARVRITSLRGEGGPGVELLEYLSPRDGRPFGPATAADGSHWEITVLVRDVDAVARRLELARGQPAAASTDVSALGLGYTRAELVRDPDGHTLRLVQR